MFEKKDYSYTLPKELIAQEAVRPHHDARLMIVSQKDGTILGESTFWNIDEYIPSDRILFFNNSRVERARIRLDSFQIRRNATLSRARNGEVLFLEKKTDTLFEGLVRPGKKLKIGTEIILPSGSLKILGETDNGRLIECVGTTIDEVMQSYGELPLPPYIEYSREKEADYQTVFASKNGSVAAPTASLHFTEALMEKIKNEKRFLTLHVGLGTFQGLDQEDIRNYAIHSEIVEVSRKLFEEIASMKSRGKKILAVGTTACRSLESLPHVWRGLKEEEKLELASEYRAFWDDCSRSIEEIQVEEIINQNGIFRFKTRIYIYPGVPFRIVDELITNFHLPESSLIVLVAALIGRDQIMRIYSEAIKKSYRFFSFGDGMYIAKT